MKLVEDLEARSPVDAPAHTLELIAGTWNVLFTTITILVTLGVNDEFSSISD